MFVFQFVSLTRKSGKTSIIVQLVRLLKERGLRVGVIKHGHSYDPAFDLKSEEDAKDTVKFVNAGSDVTVAVTDDATITITGIGSLERIIESISSQVDVALLEGFKEEESYPRIIVAEEVGAVSRLITSNTVAVAGKAAESCYDELKRLFPSLIIAKSAEDLASAIYSFIVEKAVESIGGRDCGICGYQNCEAFISALRSWRAKPTACPQVFPRVSVYLDGKRLPLNPFVQSMIENTVRGMLSSLKGFEKSKKIEVFIYSVPRE